MPCALANKISDKIKSCVPSKLGTQRGFVLIELSAARTNARAAFISLPVKHRAPTDSSGELLGHPNA